MSMFLKKLSYQSKSFNKLPLFGSQIASFHSSPLTRGFEEFFDEKKAGEVITFGRGWTAADLRRKNFYDLQKLWYVLYKERNLLLTSKERAKKNSRPWSQLEDNRYISVKRSMAAIKFVLEERHKIRCELKKELLDPTMPDHVPIPGQETQQTEQK